VGMRESPLLEAVVPMPKVTTVIGKQEAVVPMPKVTTEGSLRDSNCCGGESVNWELLHDGAYCLRDASTWSTQPCF
jgi:hypothetical protein